MVHVARARVVDVSEISFVTTESEILRVDLPADKPILSLGHKRPEPEQRRLRRASNPDQNGKFGRQLRLLLHGKQIFFRSQGEHSRIREKLPHLRISDPRFRIRCHCTQPPIHILEELEEL